MDQILNFFMNSAYTAEQTAATPTPQGGGFSFILMFVIFFVFVYFAIWRPQSRRNKEQQNLLSSLSKGDEVMTSGGMLGKITKITDQYVNLSIANNVDIVVQKAAIINILPKGTLKSIE